MCLENHLFSLGQRSISHIGNHWLISFLDVKIALKLFEGRACDLINTSTSITLVLNIGLEIFMEVSIQDKNKY